MTNFMEVKFNIIRPNLCVTGDEIYFGIDSSDVIPVSRSINESIGKYIGVLKVKESDLDVAESEESKNTSKDYSVPLTKYLDVIERKSKYEFGKSEITNSSAELFGLTYVINAQTIENGYDVADWRALQRDLADPDKAFDKHDKSNLVYRLDREKTLKEMRKLHEELNPKIQDNYAEFAIVNEQIPSSEKTITPQKLGVINLIQLKAKDKTKIKEAKADLVERLKEVDGPSLSFDAPQTYRQMMRLYADAPKLIQNYGDVLRIPMWQTRLFKLDP